MHLTGFLLRIDITDESEIFGVVKGKLAVVDEGVIAVAKLCGIHPDVCIRQVFSKDEINLIEAAKPNPHTGDEWTESSKKRINARIDAEWVKLPKYAFSREDIVAILAVRKRLLSLKPCYTWEYYVDYAKRTKGMNWIAACNYASQVFCGCEDCFEE